jgi:hypothetical protein
MLPATVSIFIPIERAMAAWLEELIWKMPTTSPEPLLKGLPEESNCRKLDSQLAIAIMTGSLAKYDRTCASTPAFVLMTGGVLVATGAVVVAAVDVEAVALVAAVVVAEVVAVCA